MIRIAHVVVDAEDCYVLVDEDTGDVTVMSPHLPYDTSRMSRPERRAFARAALCAVALQDLDDPTGHTQWSIFLFDDPCPKLPSFVITRQELMPPEWMLVEEAREELEQVVAEIPCSASDRSQV